jgi:hypothetical protein
MSRCVIPVQTETIPTDLFAVGVSRCIVKVRTIIQITTGLMFRPGRPISRIL